MTHQYKKRTVIHLLWFLTFIVILKYYSNFSLLFVGLSFFINNKFQQKKMSHIILSNKGFFILVVFLLSQNFYFINLNQSLNTIQFMLLAHYKFLFILITLLFLLMSYYLLQEDIPFHFIHPSELAFSSIKRLKAKKNNYVHLYSESRTKLNRKNIMYLIKDIPRHGYLNYTNYMSLSEQYFKMCQHFIEEDDHLYLILSETGSPASEIISLFTHREFNHLSLSFDRSLHTMISYNGGNHHQRPGLNTEDFTSFNQKTDSQLLVYSLKATKDEQTVILNKIKQINQEGSAYNVVGLLTKLSVRPNMMYCSQFVYQMLAISNLNVFKATEEVIKPTDFIENDWAEKLTFEYKIDFSTINREVVS